MEKQEQLIQGRVRKNTPEDQNIKIDKITSGNLQQYAYLSSAEKTQRLEELKKEWDIERMLEVNASVVMLAGLVLGKLVSKRWFGFSGLVAGFLLQHGLQGWCPPLPLFRALGVRTRREIDEEIYALKALRGDFDNISASSGPAEVINKIRT